MVNFYKACSNAGLFKFLQIYSSFNNLPLPPTTLGQADSLLCASSGTSLHSIICRREVAYHAFSLHYPIIQLIDVSILECHGFDRQSVDRRS
jgi:hypothetical protein